ncbi:MAG: DNA-processing protein DprA [Clostridia bacterium]|nr:DNA-processing protein DprA [Clostridia bacterium]
MNNRIIWIWLSLHFGAGNKIYQKLYNHFGSIEAIYDSDDADVDTIKWLSNSYKRSLLDKNLDHAHEVVEWCEDNNVQIVTPSDAEYPFPLRQLDDYPPVLYYRGKLPHFERELCISVVGTRKMTVYGQKNAYELGFGLAKGGAIVVSGMALGIDCTAQKGALYAGGSAIAVLGSGIDVVYPLKNAALMEKIARVGAVITEYPPHTPPNGYNFPIRNRIISALSTATVVVEADLNSGAMITANLALKQGKDLFAFPGPVKYFSTTGTNKLISEGALMATAAIDVLEHYLDRFSDKIDLQASKERPVFEKALKVASNFDSESFYATSNSKENSQTEEKATQKFDTSALSEKEKLVYDKMEFDKPVSLDFFASLELDTSDLAMCITMLEINGAIESLPGGFYKKK